MIVHSIDLDPMTQSYLETALWLEEPEELFVSGQWHPKPDWNVGMFSKEAVQLAERDCLVFFANCGKLIPDHLLRDAGHSLWLNRNGHGSGFWDSPEKWGEDASEELSECATAMGTADLYQGDDGKLYFSQ